MSRSVGIDRLVLSRHRPAGYVPRPRPELLRRIRAFGIVDPVVVRPLQQGQFEILTNPETWRAAGELNLHEVPVLIREDISDEEAADIVRGYYVIQEANPLDEARDFEASLRRMGFASTRRGHYPRGALAKLATMTGRRVAYLSHALRLLRLPSEVQVAVREGRLSAGQARPLVTIPDEMDQIAAAREILDQRLSARAAEALARRYRDGSAPAAGQAPTTRQPAKSADVVHLERRVSELIGAGFEIEGGRAVIDFYGDFEILEGILERMGYRGD